MRLRIAMFCAAAIGVALSMAAPASAATAQERRKACSEEWNAAKEAGKVKDGETWSKFYSECNARLKEVSEAKPAETKASTKKTSDFKSAAKPAASAAKPEAETSTRQSRMKQCSEEWSAAKAAGKVSSGQTWPKFYSECNARLSGEAPAAATSTATTTTAAPAAASTRESRMKQCSEEWSAAKAAGKVSSGQTWPKFYSECNARLSGEAPAATTAATTTTAAPAAATTGKSRQQQCSDEWSAAKAAGKVPSGQTWPKFYSECNARLSGEAPAVTTTAKPTTTTATPASVKVEDDEDTGEGVREPTPGQLAARARMKDCGAEWRASKAAGKIIEGQTWPQYWSACNKRLKAAGR